jgi:S1-C subfamily serine protease
VLVAFVEEHSQAAQDGLNRGDIIMRVDGQAIKTLDELMAVLTTDVPEQHILNVLREQREVTIRLQQSAK